MSGLQLFAHSCGGSAGIVDVTGPASLLAPDVVFLGNRNATDCMFKADRCQVAPPNSIPKPRRECDPKSHRAV